MEGPGGEFRFSIARAQAARLAVFDPQGRRVRELLDEWAEPGTRAVRWDGRSDGGAAVASGVYYVCLEVGETRVARAFVKVR